MLDWALGLKGGGADGWAYGNSPLCSIGHWPFGAAAKKLSNSLFWSCYMVCGN